MPNNITDSLGFIANKTNYKELLKRKQKQVDKFTKAINKDIRKMKGKNIISNILGLIRRIPFQKFEKSFYEHAIKIEKTCILCKKCIDLCPVDNFSIKDYKLIENDKCVLCYRCINHCPIIFLLISKKN